VYSVVAQRGLPARPNEASAIEREVAHTRSRVSLFDSSSLTKLPSQVPMPPNFCIASMPTALQSAPRADPTD
jgi:glycine cleavage system aminomethyltransferase T